jgi:signal transduction histidine kinase
MRPEVLDKLFKPYITEKSEQNPEGIGLGLHITKYLTELMGANIQVESQLGKGTSFDIRFNLEKELTE